MSTNFYMKRLPTEEDQRTILNLAQAQEYAQLSRFVDKGRRIAWKPAE